MVLNVSSKMFLVLKRCRKSFIVRGTFSSDCKRDSKGKLTRLEGKNGPK